MYSATEKLPDHSRVWIYQSNRELTGAEIESIGKETQNFLETWTAHDNALMAGFEIRYNRFIILMIDEKVAGASGCSIDKSVHFIQSLEKKYQTSFMDRMKFAFKQSDRVEVVSGKVFGELFSNGAIDNNSIVFNNLVSTKAELKAAWEVPLKNSWHKDIVNT